MNRLVQLVRHFNYASSWNQPKHSLAKRITHLLTIPVEPRIYERIQGDLTMRLDLSSYFERWIYLNTYDVVTIQLLRRLLRPGDAYVDAGTNLGLFALVASRAVGERGRVYAFEPAPATLDRLHENLRLSSATNVQVLAKGCWHESNLAELHEFKNSHHGEVSMRPISDKSVHRSVVIETVRIDETVPAPVRVLKADVEGAEWPALRGAEKLLEHRQPPHLIVELNRKTCSAFGYDPMELVDWLLGLRGGYRMHLIKSKRRAQISRHELARLFEAEPYKFRDVWFEPSP